MQSLLYSLNIGTLATWLSVAGFGSVAVMVPVGQSGPGLPPVEETLLIDESFTLGNDASPAPDENPPEAPSALAEPAQPAEPLETLPAPPAMPELAELAPLPDVPDPPLPRPAPVARATSDDRTPAPRNKPRVSAPAAPRNPRPSAAGGSGPAGAPSTMSTAARLAAGRMPPPVYPAEARRKGQTGTLIVEFTVDTSGRVISAYLTSPSAWPLLNEQAIRAVRGWKFPPGPVMKLQRPIIFQLR